MRGFPNIRIISAPVCLAICLLSTGFTDINGIADSSITNGLVGYWNFDETSGGTLHDLSGNGYNGTVVNYPGGQGNWTSGLTGGALQFGGPSTREYVSVPNFATPTSSLSLSAWVSADSLPPWATIAANWNGAWGAFDYTTYSNGRNMSLYVADRESPPGSFNIDNSKSSDNLSLSKWHFMAFVANNSTHTITFVQDGVSAGSFHYTGNLLPSSSQLIIGGDPSDKNPGQGNWNGRIDDLAIWSRALSLGELTSIYNAGLSGTPLLSSVPEPSVVALSGLGMSVLVLLTFARGAKHASNSGRPLRYWFTATRQR